MQRPQRAVHERLAVATPEVEPEPQHLPMAFRQGLEPHRDLRHREEDVQELQSSRLCGVGTVPFEHVGVDRRRPGTQPQIDRVNPVGKHVRGAVASAEHAAVLADRRHVVDDAVRPDFARVVHAQVMPRLQPRTDKQRFDAEIRRTHVRNGIVERRDDGRDDRAGNVGRVDPLHGEHVDDRRAVLVARPVQVGRDAEADFQLVAFEQPVLDVGVADVDAKYHGFSSRFSARRVFRARARPLPARPPRALLRQARRFC